MMIVVLKVNTLVWFTLGTLFSFRALRELFDPALQPARNAWRRQEFGEREAQRRAAFYRTNLAFLRTFISVMTLWPVIWGSVLRDRWREIRRESKQRDNAESKVTRLDEHR
jgi:hypothetical protein